ncbi:hypothetical protein EC973_009615 [Apophysomyces ossiformis]|uniref:Cytosolic endo-beta-N-acetylglucosaminidase TIM barrel domain-containing protein n=1 Tax=Apophysomyces ossiformis TaxID=679940 RepID=A0A8H7BLM7_9FUNG|nr:hypothetical protein EC973_009615 [Apophysomyces ossiformis]
MTELNHWTPSGGNVFNIATVPRRTRPQHTTPNMMLCHDMAGGYVEDYAIQGNNYSTIYNVQYWQYVDTFIYFSHNRVTIPPVVWTNAMHRNGVSSLGTFLVEGESGTPDLDTFLMGPNDQSKNQTTVADKQKKNPKRIWSTYYPDKLVALAKYYGFDGWLINIESNFSRHDASPQFKGQQLAELMQYLTTKMHKEIPGSSIIWYDALTVNGEVDYQNELNKWNAPFFEATDGLFVNYWWEANYPEKAARLAKKEGRTPKDVYFGTDVWGRGTYGGGQYNTYKGVEASDKGGTSSVLFAMAWTYQHFNEKNFNFYDRLLWMGGPSSDYPPETNEEEKDDYGSATKRQKQKERQGVLRKRAAKDAVDDNSNEYDQEGWHKGIADFDKLRDVPVPWFATWFDRGYGSVFCFQGERLLHQAWSQLSHQGILPNLDYRKPVHAGHLVLQGLLSDRDPYMSGTSLILKATAGKETAGPAVAKVPLYRMKLDMRQGTSMRFIYKVNTRVSQVSIYCHLSLHPEVASVWKDKVSDLPLVTPAGSSNGTHGLYEVEVPLGSDFQQQAATGSNDWTIKDIQTNALPDSLLASGAMVEEIGWKIHVNPDEDKTVLANLGYLSVIPANSPPPAPSSNATALNLQWQTKEYHATHGSKDKLLWATLGWTSNAGPSNAEMWSETDYFIVSLVDAHQTNKLFLGTAFVDQYRISGLGPNQFSYVKVEAVDRLGHVKAEGTIALN